MSKATIYVGWSVTDCDPYVRRDCQQMLNDHSEWCREHGFEQVDAAAALFPKVVAALRGCKVPTAWPSHLYATDAAMRLLYPPEEPKP